MKKYTKNNTLKKFCKKKIERNDVKFLRNSFWNIIKKRKTCKKEKWCKKKKWMNDFRKGFLESCMKRNSKKKPINYS